METQNLRINDAQKEKLAALLYFAPLETQMLCWQIGAGSKFGRFLK